MADEVVVIKGAEESVAQVPSNEEGNLQDNSNLENQNEGQDDQNDSQEEPQDELEFTFEDIDKELGLASDFKVELPEGVDEYSREGIIARQQALIKYGQDQTWQQLQAQDPLSYQFVLHRLNGGTVQDFFESGPAYTWNDVENNIDLQRQIVKDDLLGRGVSEKIANLQVEDLVKEKTLAETSKKIVDAAEQVRNERNDELTQQQQEREEAEAKAWDQLGNYLVKQYKEGKLKTIGMLPEDIRGKAYENFTESLTSGQNGFVYFVDVTNDNLENLMELDYLLKNPGALAKLLGVTEGKKAVASMRSNFTKKAEKPKVEVKPVDQRISAADVVGQRYFGELKN